MGGFVFLSGFLLLGNSRSNHGMEAAHFSNFGRQLDCEYHAAPANAQKTNQPAIDHQPEDLAAGTGGDCRKEVSGAVGAEGETGG